MKKQRARVFQTGGSQAIRLPKEYRFKESEVLIHREGRKVIIEPVDEWPEEFLKCLGAWHEDIPRPKQQKLTDVRNPLE
ncbi:MAG: AbrB/MazE/SpoVT family DNA-binding domain-containing protein [Candidatus Hydrogenedentes bacterium]|nr:AbrB/MazE/SpoVT family DNA-binding domain-containing protein [Candidatus Hydrogenedentota bacterium]